MTRIVTIRTQKSMNEDQYQAWLSYLAEFEILTTPEIERLKVQGKLTTVKNSSVADYSIEQVN
jgi:hypothetical protein